VPVAVPDASTPVVDPAAVARKLDVAAPSAEMLDAITEAILDAQADAAAYLGRPVLPRSVTEPGCWPWPGGWQLTEDPIWEVTATVAEVTPVDGILTGYYTVTYVGGLDARTDPDCAPVRRWVKAAAANDPSVIRAWAATGAFGVRKMVMTEGQRVMFETLALGGGGKAGADSPGALPSKSIMDALRRAHRRVYTPPLAPLPNGPGGGYGEVYSTDPYADRDRIWY
jgi:hypothetical protein